MSFNASNDQLQLNSEKKVHEWQNIKNELANWGVIVKKYNKPNSFKAFYQIFESFGLFLALWIAMYYSLSVSYWLTVGLGFLNAFMLVKIFIIQHDCGHQSFLKSKKAMNIIGNVCSIFSLIPYEYWAKSHNFHHGHNGQLEFRDIGDLKVLTVEEYKSLNNADKVKYRIFRSPIVLFFFVPIFYIFFHGRFVTIKNLGWQNTWKMVTKSNIYMALAVGLTGFVLGWKVFLLVQMPIWIFFGIIAIWFFYVQHQHEPGYKEWKNKWDYLLSAIKGSSFYDLPKFMHWLTGNIGYHHIHHLSSLIPNYNLKKVHDENPILQKYVYKMDFLHSFKCMFNKLWDENQKKMITMREYKLLYEKS